MYFFYYMPVGLDTENRRFPVLTVFFAAVCAAVFLVNRYAPDLVPLDFHNLVFYPGLSHLLTSLTAAFLHFGWLHLLGNLIYLLLFGAYLEDRLGPVIFTLVYLGSAVVGNVMQGWYNLWALDAAGVGVIGASGAVSGVMGALLVRLYVARVKVAYWVFMPLQGYTRGGRVEVPIAVAMVFWVLIQVTQGLLQMEGAASGVAYMTHIAGFAFGIVVTYLTGGGARGRVEAHWIRAQRSLRAGDLWTAHDELTRFVTHCPEDGRAHAMLARVLAQTGDGLGAQANYLKACEMLLRSNLRGEAEDAYQEAVRGYPGFSLSAEPQLNMAFGLERNLKPAAAVAAYETFCRRFRRHRDAPLALLRSGNLLAGPLDNQERARQCYERLVRFYPEDDWADFAIEQIRILTSRSPGASMAG